MKLNKKMKKRIMSTVAAVIGMTIAMSSVAVANAETASTVWRKNGYYYKGTLETSYVADRKQPIYDSQARHKKGTETTLSISRTKSFSTESSVNLTAGYDEIIVLEETVGVAETETTEVSMSVSYTLKNQRSGLYRMIVVYPGKKVTRTIEKKSVNAKTNAAWTLVSKTTSKYTPRRNASYTSYERYAD